MRVQRRSAAVARPVRRRGKEQKSWKLKFGILLYLLVVVPVLFGVANYRIDLNRKISELQRADNRAKQEIGELDRDIQALKVARDQLSNWYNVKSRIARYNMQFRAADARQVCHIAVKRSKYRSADNQFAGDALAMNQIP